MPAIQRLTALLLGSASCFAQTYVVDAQNGPGANFVEISQAVATVPDGAVLVVRPGAYQGFAITAKSIAILGGGAVTVSGDTVVSGTLAHQTVTLRNLTWSSFANDAPLQVQNCAGLVTLEGLHMPTSPVFSSVNPFFGVTYHTKSSFRATACDRLTLRQGTFYSPVISNSNAVVQSSVLQGQGAGVHNNQHVVGAHAGLSFLGGSLQVTGTTQLLGGIGLGFGLVSSPAGAALSMGGGSDVRLLSGSLVGGDGGGLFGTGGAVVSGFGGTLRMDPRVFTQSTNSSPFAIPAVITPMPAVVVNGGAIGATATAAVATDAGNLTILLLGLPGPVTSLPGIVGAFWLSPTAFSFHTIGLGPLTGSLTVPSNATLVGLPLVWQAVVDQSGQLLASNPAVTVVH